MPAPETATIRAESVQSFELPDPSVVPNANSTRDLRSFSTTRRPLLRVQLHRSGLAGHHRRRTRNVAPRSALASGHSAGPCARFRRLLAIEHAKLPGGKKSWANQTANFGG